MYGILSIRGLSTAQMGSLGEFIETFRDSYRPESPEQQPEVVFDAAVEQVQPSNPETNNESDDVSWLYSFLLTVFSPPCRYLRPSTNHPEVVAIKSAWMSFSTCTSNPIN
jgi:hypothetical protein